ncbi:ArsB/NhaD family transporter [Caloranaerobacter azorensis]|uniref:Possible tyrosine transporter P-protein (TC 2.A.45.2.1) n=3 Tax=Caloranaerobacter azorensis TaxID=116090 RepID=A0A1M5WHH6_9FIRM|nr:ArsB/NhaD family transporter [Caloranaerobacter azorensis]KGG81343.1 membrane protein [Caloranaerobacter azorensis H53214]QIB26343.1 ArsB/NhaD family transporter [Caloranaerobacter azorensis]SHH86915.1 possible tyrosine transporter P-protein (TC 2.A.45.2.1) [Caloranaerobacter azorensis DSM 13643]
MLTNSHVYIAAIVFILTYAFIISEKINRTAVALLGAAIMLGLKVISQEYAFESIDFNTIGLLIGMMIIITITKRTGVFQYIAIKSAKLAKGDPWKIILSFSIITAISSALLDNVTTVLLLAPVTLVITDTLNLNPIPFLLPEILSANIGGTATLIGDPPNIMIGSATGLGFLDFLFNLGPVVIVILSVVILILKLIYGKELIVDEEHKKRIMNFDEYKAIKDHSLLKKSLIVLGFTIIGFALHQVFEFESATVALIGASTLLVLSKINPEEVLIELEWTTIFFFAGLFILVGALEEVGIIETIAEKVVFITKGNLFLTTLMIIWVSAIASAFIDNIPFVATMIPLIKSIGSMSNINTTPLWWALALGACLGGNGSLVGASANVIVAGMLEKTKYKLTFIDFIKIGFPIMIVSVLISTIYLIVFYI